MMGGLQQCVGRPAPCRRRARLWCPKRPSSGGACQSGRPGPTGWSLETIHRGTLCPAFLQSLCTSPSSPACTLFAVLFLSACLPCVFLRFIACTLPLLSLSTPADAGGMGQRTPRNLFDSRGPKRRVKPPLGRPQPPSSSQLALPTDASGRLPDRVGGAAAGLLTRVLCGSSNRRWLPQNRCRLAHSSF